MYTKLWHPEHAAERGTSSPAVCYCRPFVSESLQARRHSWYAMAKHLATHAMFCLTLNASHCSGLFWRKLRSEVVQRLLVGKVSAIKHMCSLLCAKHLICRWDKSVILYGDDTLDKSHPVAAFLVKEKRAKSISIFKSG